MVEAIKHILHDCTDKSRAWKQVISFLNLGWNMNINHFSDNISDTGRGPICKLNLSFIANMAKHFQKTDDIFRQQRMSNMQVLNEAILPRIL